MTNTSSSLSSEQAEAKGMQGSALGRLGLGALVGGFECIHASPVHSRIASAADTTRSATLEK